MTTTANVGAEESLAKVLEELVDRKDGEGLRTVVLDRLRRAEAWAPRAVESRKALVEGIAGLAKAKDLDEGVRLLDQADHSWFKRFVRDHPNLFVRRIRTADHLRAFLAEHGTPAARAAFARALRDLDAPSGVEVARFLIEAIDRGDDRAVADAVERFVRRFDGGPEADERATLRRHIDDLVLALKKAQKLDDLPRALERAEFAATRKFPGVDLFGLGEQLLALASHFGANDARAALAAVADRKLPRGTLLATEAVRLIAGGRAQEALDFLSQEILSPLEDKAASADRTADAARCLSEAVEALAKAGKLETLLKVASAADAAYTRENPHAIYAGIEHRIQSAVDRVGSEGAKAAFRKARAG